MNIERRYWKRSGYIAIEDDSGELVKFGRERDGFALDFKFSGKKWGDCYGMFNCAILGLTREHINQFTVWDNGQAMRRKRRVQVFAGYADENMATPIFDGFVMEAIPTNPPERWLNIQAVRAFDKADVVSGEKPVEGDKTQREVAQKIAEIVGLGFGDDCWRCEDNDGKSKVAKFHFNNEKKSMLPHLFASKFGLRVYAEDGQMIITDQRGWLKQSKNAKEISVDTGLISVSAVTMYGADIVRRLDDTVKMCDWIRLDSKMIPGANPKPYFVIEKEHRGHLRGEEWFTTLKTIRQGAKI